MNIQLIRHATTRIEMNGLWLLVDPMLAAAGTIRAVPGVPDGRMNPLTELPGILDPFDSLDAVLLSHMHPDHFDQAACQLLPPDIIVFCQPEDAGWLSDQGFTNVQAIDSMVSWRGISIWRTGGRHGSGKIAEQMGPVSGYVLSCPGQPTIYITGDTVWCPQVTDAITRHHPQVIVCYAGEARFAQGDPITMGTADILELAIHAPMAQIIAIHMEAWNHCRLSRRALKEFCAENGILNRVLIPENGETMCF